MTPMQMFLADDDACVFCGHVSDKGIVAEVEGNRFFACAACLFYRLVRVAGWKESITGFVFEGSRNSRHMCVACGRERLAGIYGRDGNHWYFLCEGCRRSTIPAMLTAWFGLGEKPRRPRKGSPQGAGAEGVMAKIEREMEKLRRSALEKDLHVDYDEHVLCGTCDFPINLETMKCPICRQQYCQYCGGKVGRGRCTKCGAVPDLTQREAGI